MPANPAAAKNMLLSTDYPLDKIVYLKSGSTVAATGVNTDIYFAHNLPFTPLVVGSWSYDPNFTTSYMAGLQPFAPAVSTSVTIQSNAVNTRVLIGNNTGVTQTIYWRIYGYMPPDADADVLATASLADRFAFNTDYNYTKLYASGLADITTATVVVPHNLGYRPQVEIWFELALIPGQYEREYLGIANPGDTFYNAVYIDNNNLIIRKGTGANQSNKYYYRIYLDE